MVFKPEPVFEAVEASKTDGCKVVLPSPQGPKFTRHAAQQLAAVPHVIFICGRYEGVDERIREALVDEEYSIGDFVTMGGELPSLLMTEALARFVPGVVGDEQSVILDSFQNSLLDYPHYTRPSEYRGRKVPEVLLSGHHEQVRLWRRKMMLRRTLERRADLLKEAELSAEDRKLLEDIRQENEH
jgi:tRNA (guanine37-N1)-methyltransferase